MGSARAIGSVIALLATIGCAQPPRVDVAAEEHAIRQRFAEWVAVEKARDLEASVAFLTADALIHGPGAPAVQGVDAARPIWKAFFEIPYTDLVTVGTRTVVVAQSGDLASDFGSWKLIVPGSADQGGKSAITWQKRDGKWMVTALAFSMDAPPAPAPAPAPSGKR